MPFFSRRKPEATKIFCIGQNKTGTTSLESALAGMGYRAGNQEKAERLLDDWAKRDFTRIIRYCNTADFFQDVPFGNDDTYQALDQAFPGSKFILTIRDNKDQWYRSLTRFHTKVIGKHRLPTADDLKNHKYRNKAHFKGFLWKIQTLKYGIDESSLYDYDVYTAKYEDYNRKVIDYFKGRDADFLVLNVANEDSLERLCRFLGKEYQGGLMPHVNTSK